jgi:hypothetical protein
LENLDREAINSREVAVEQHVGSALEHLNAAVGLMSDRRKKLANVSGKRYVEEALSSLKNMKIRMSRIFVSQPEGLVYREEDLVSEVTSEIRQIEKSINELLVFLGEDGIETTSFEEVIKREGSFFFSLIRSFVERQQLKREGLNCSLEALGESLQKVNLLASRAGLIENITRPGVLSELERIRGFLFSFAKQYLRRKRAEAASISRTEGVRKRRVRRKVVTGPSRMNFFL